MAIYKCVKSYKSYNGKNHYYGNTISDSVYNSLPYREWSNFQKQYQEEVDDAPSSASSLINSGIAFDESFSSGSDTSSSDTSFDSGSDSSSSDTSFDFGGGDGGGAGSSGDW